MTDARFPERYLSDRRVLRLTADEFRGWSFATIWSVSNRTDGVILSDELMLIPFMKVETAQKLEACGLWATTDGGWIISDFVQTQTSRHELEVLDNARRRDREKKARQRAAKNGSGPTFSDVPGDGPGGTSRGRPGDVSRRTAQAGQAGKKRPGSLTTERARSRNPLLPSLLHGDRDRAWSVGLTSLLTHPFRGARVRTTSTTTTAPLRPDGRADEQDFGYGQVAATCVGC